MIVAYFTGADPKVFISRSGIIKLIELLLLIIAMSTFFSGLVSFRTSGSSLYFVSSMMVSAFLHTVFILLAFVLGGLAIQKTLFDLMVSGFYVFMLLTASIVAFVIAGDGSVVASGVFLLFCAITFAADCYVAFCQLNSSPVTVGGVATPGASAGVQPHLQQQHPHTVQSQPYTPPPAYSTPPGLVGGGPYTIPMSGHGEEMRGGVGAHGDMKGETNNVYDNNDDIYSELGEGPTTVYYNEGGPENII